MAANKKPIPINAHTLELTSNENPSLVSNNFSLVAKVLIDKKFNPKVLKDLLFNTWKNKGTLTLAHLEQNMA